MHVVMIRIYINMRMDDLILPVYRTILEERSNEEFPLYGIAASMS